MAQLKLLLTVDYEIFGDGSGEVLPCMIQSSENLMRIAEDYGAAILFFAEMNEYWAFKELEVEHPFYHKHQEWAQLIERQLKNIIQRQHNVQLHLHPQWIDATLSKEGHWQLNFDYWRLPKVPNGLGHKEDPKSLLGLFHKGKQTLESILQRNHPDYICDTFRAGAWCIQPEKQILDAMRQIGFSKDSTLAPGMSMNNGLTYFDFSKSKSGFKPFPIDQKITESSSAETSLTEFPIWTSKINLLRNLYHTALVLKRGLANNAPNCIGQSAAKSQAAVKKQSFLKKAWELVRPQYKMLDFCGRKTSEELIYLSKRAIAMAQQEPDDSTYPLVAIGHPKNFGNDNELRKWLDWVAKQKEMTFSTDGQLT